MLAEISALYRDGLDDVPRTVLRDGYSELIELVNRGELRSDVLLAIAFDERER